MKYFALYLPVLFLLFFTACTPPKVVEWRGPNRSGVYNEKNLLKQWPDSGPKLLWEYEGIGNGYGTPLITDELIYVNGEVDSTGYMFAFSKDGKLQWKTEYGKEWTVNFPGSRATPTYYDGLLYTCSGKGDISCFNAADGDKIWPKNMLNELSGKENRFGYSQSLVVDREKVYCSPGGEENNIVALNRLNGEIVWSSPAEKEISAYCSPILVNYAGKNILITFSEHHLLGINAENGNMLWSHEQDTLCDIHANTPIFDNGFVYYTAGCGNMTYKLKISEDGNSVSEVWQNKSLDNYFGGCVKIGNSIIGTGARKKYLKRVDCETGLLTDSLKVGTGSTIYADGMLYMYNQQGEIHLIDPSGELKSVSMFKLTKGSKEHFSHPTIDKGVLYIRRGNYIAAYNISNNQK